MRQKREIYSAQTVRDKQAVGRLREKYKDYVKWGENGVIHLIEQHLQCQKLRLRNLKLIAITLSFACQDRCSPLGRQEKRRLEFLDAWLNLNKDLFAPLIPRLVVENVDGTVLGSDSATWQHCKRRYSEIVYVKDSEESQKSDANQNQ